MLAITGLISLLVAARLWRFEAQELSIAWGLTALWPWFARPGRFLAAGERRPPDLGHTMGGVGEDYGGDEVRLEAATAAMPKAFGL